MTKPIYHHILKTNIEFWFDPKRKPLSVMLAAWMSSLMDARNLVIERTRESAEAYQHHIHETMTRGPIFKAPTYDRMGMKTYIYVCEKRKTLDSEIARIAALFAFAEQNLSSALQRGNFSEAYDAMNILLGVIEPPREALGFNPPNYDWLVNTKNAGGVIMTAWRNTAHLCLSADNRTFCTLLDEALKHGPRMASNLSVSAVRAGPAITMTDEPDEPFAKITNPLYEAQQRLGDAPTAFAINREKQLLAETFVGDALLCDIVPKELLETPEKQPGLSL